MGAPGAFAPPPPPPPPGQAWTAAHAMPPGPGTAGAWGAGHGGPAPGQGDVRYAYGPGGPGWTAPGWGPPPNPPRGDRRRLIAVGVGGLIVGMLLGGGAVAIADEVWDRAERDRIGWVRGPGDGPRWGGPGGRWMLDGIR